MHMRPLWCSVFAVLLFGAAGCATFLQDIEDRQVRGAVELQRLNVCAERAQEQMAALQQAQEHASREIESLRRELALAAADGERRGADLERRIGAIERGREKDKQEVVDALSRRMSEVLARQSQAQQPPAGAKWYEHIVKPGETLSEIAKAYGVSVPAIVRANNLSNPDSIRVGMKVLIPGEAGAR